MHPFVMNGEEKTINMQMYFHSLQIDLYTSSVEDGGNRNSETKAKFNIL